MPKIVRLAGVPRRVGTHSSFHFCGGIFLALAWVAVSSAQAQTTNYSLGTTALLVGPAEGTNSVVLGVTPATGLWTAAPNTNWLHLDLANQSGAGSTNVIFTYDANPGTTRSGTLTIGNQTLTVTQAGSTYVPAASVTTLVSSGLSDPQSVAVDGTGNIYIADAGNNAVKEWTVANNTVTTLISSGLDEPYGVAVDSAGNVYIADAGDNAIKEWTVANSQLTTLVSSNLNSPSGLAVDGAGNVYIADTFNHAIKVWTAANSNVTALVSVGVGAPTGVALDAAGNVYIGDPSDNAVEEWTFADSNVTTLVSAELLNPYGVAVDSSGNVYIADLEVQTINEWTAANSSLITLVSSGLNQPQGVAVDGAGNVYIADSFNNAIKELPNAFVDPTPRLESLSAGNDALPAVLPFTENLLAQFAPTTSDPQWLTISGVTNGVVNFAFTATSSNRTGYINLLGQNIPITQGSPTLLLATTNLLEGPEAGSDSVVLAVVPELTAWSATTNASWLHLSVANQNGTGSANVVFSFGANTGVTRSGTLTIAGQTLTVTQAGSTYVAAGALTTLVSGRPGAGQGLAVDGAGNLYLADIGGLALQEWVATNNLLYILVGTDYPGGLTPEALAVDGAGNVYIASAPGTIFEWMAATYDVTTLVSAGLYAAQAVAVDGSGNVYIADAGDNAIKEWTVANSNLVTLVSSGLNEPIGVAVDGAGNLYIADFAHNAIEEWTSANNTLNSLVSSGLNGPWAVAVDGAGNVYFADYYNRAIKKWAAANSNVTTLVTSASGTIGVAVDGAGNVYFDDGEIKELPRAFVDPTPKLEGLAAGGDSLPAVLPVTENLLPPFSPSSDQSWLSITGITNDVVSFSFTANPGPARTAHITLLGQTIPITQGVIGTPPNLTGPQMLGNGVVQFSFTNIPSASFTVLSSTDLSLPLTEWAVIGTASNTAPGMFQFTSAPTTNDAQRFYIVRSP